MIILHVPSWSASLSKDTSKETSTQDGGRDQNPRHLVSAGCMTHQFIKQTLQVLSRVGHWLAGDSQIEQQALQRSEAGKVSQTCGNQQVQRLAGGSCQIVQPWTAQGLIDSNPLLRIPDQNPARISHLRLARRQSTEA